MKETTYVWLGMNMYKYVVYDFTLIRIQTHTPYRERLYKNNYCYLIRHNKHNGLIYTQ